MKPGAKDIKDSKDFNDSKDGCAPMGHWIGENQ
jgi:hypothetical protein